MLATSFNGLFGSFSNTWRGLRTVAYVMYVLQKYGKSHIVFDGYELSPSTKDHQQDFLSNSTNKSRLIELLKVHVESSGFRVRQAPKDFCVMIIATVVSLIDSGLQSVIVGYDTDLLVLLIALSKKDNDIKMVKPGTKNRPTSSGSSVEEEVSITEECFLLASYGERPDSDEDMAEYRAYLKTVSKQPMNANYILAACPPTSAAAK
ncbi:hypothetical protein PR048_024197 [Dryococelus australis]|uniref:NYN domain-containing protein n=1 Tax=Dryococelus australis TaxID=614101 RepID=A0ABQ9GW80_9NEOP|nr:hypothetical protein PR048_024197 [Dryococelus australis]